MKVSLIIKKSVKRYDTDSQATIYVRLRDGRTVDMVAPTSLTINPNFWDDKAEQIKSKVLCDDNLRTSINDEVRKLKSYLEKEYQSNEEELTKDWLKIALDKYYNPKKYYTEEEIAAEYKPPLTELFDEFLTKHKLSEVRAKNYRVIKRGIQRYELYTRATKRGKKNFTLYIDEVTPDTLRDMWDFFENEYKYFEQHPTIYESIPEKRTPQPRGRNTLLDCFSRIRTFFYWCNDNKKTQNKPFDDFPLEECTYGTPYYITIDERNKIYATNLERHPQLAIQRDIFVFQCLIGCRVGDLIKMTKANLINGAIEYIPRKTKEGRPLTVRVPLNATAQEIVERYKNCEGNKLLPFISEQKYNVAIKRIFKAAGLKRMVTVINPTTREEEKRVLYEIASSHLARRTFVGNLYKQVKDPNLVGSLSGHKEGSKAFARYREIDDEMKKELVDLLQ
ncbi:MAG: site-specific integrase [Bacteroidales bacterium]|nr:site-specific integrase [Bacteroidales bacterium]